MSIRYEVYKECKVCNKCLISMFVNLNFLVIYLLFIMKYINIVILIKYIRESLFLWRIERCGFWRVYFILFCN